MRNVDRRPFFCCVVLGFGLLAGCCRKDDEIVMYRVEKPEGAPAQVEGAGPMTTPSTMAVRSESPVDSTVASRPVKYAWDVPPEWKTLAATGMRLASFSFEGSDKTIADISVIVLSGDAGGLAANINRWRGQIGLDALPESEVVAGISRLESATGTLQTCAYSNPATHQGISAGMLVDEQETWFFKVSGPELAVSECQDSFIRFLKSLRRNP